jgi:hypothetical protein
MKKIFPFILISVFLFVTMKFINHVNEESKSFVKSDSLTSDYRPLPKEIIIQTKQEINSRRSVKILPRLQPSDFKAHCFYNCKLLPISNGLCFFPGGLSTSVDSKPLYDQHWKRQFVQYL